MADLNNSGGIWGAIAGAAAHTATGVLGMIGQRKREDRAMKNTQRLMDVQMRNQKMLDKYGQELQLDTWKKTNYPAQVGMLKEAGLNPALLYGNGGQGGVTGGQGGGSAAGGSAPAPQYMPLELGNALMLGQQIKLMQAETEKVKAETENVNANTTGKNLENNWSYETLDDRIMNTAVEQELNAKQLELVQQQSKYYASQAKAEIQKLGADAETSEKEAELKQIELDWMNAMKGVHIGSTAIEAILNIFKMWVIKQK
jgi:hypothetical protein